jgi:hypothetical protein
MVLVVLVGLSIRVKIVSGVCCVVKKRWADVLLVEDLAALLAPFRAGNDRCHEFVLATFGALLILRLAHTWHSLVVSCSGLGSRASLYTDQVDRRGFRRVWSNLMSARS